MQAVGRQFRRFLNDATHLGIAHQYALDASVLLTTDAFDPQQHPRGQPENAGEFAKTSGNATTPSKIAVRSSSKKPLTAKQKIAVLYAWTSHGFEKIQRYVSSNGASNPSMAGVVNKLHDLIQDSPLKEDTTLWRGVGLTHKQLKSIVDGVGSEIRLSSGFVATHNDEKVARQFMNGDWAQGDVGVVFKINAVAGTPALQVDAHGGDTDETLLDYASRFRIDKVTTGQKTKFGEPTYEVTVTPTESDEASYQARKVGGSANEPPPKEAHPSHEVAKSHGWQPIDGFELAKMNGWRLPKTPDYKGFQFYANSTLPGHTLKVNNSGSWEHNGKNRSDFSKPKEPGEGFQGHGFNERDLARHLEDHH